MDAVRLEAGALFAGDFRVVRPLAEGGMGAVYVAEQISTGAERALKVMRPELVLARDPAAAARNRERFLQEARVGARIESEHVVSVLGAGIDEASGAPWLAMELLAGEDLGRMAERRGRLPPAELLSIYEGLCHALGAAHRASIFHLDLKPENVFIATSRLQGLPFVVKVLDFGIAKVVLDHRQSATVTTAIGSPLWMAPEQAERGARVSAATDVWAIGLMAFRLLTGKHYWLEGNAPDGEFRVTAWLIELVTKEFVAASARAAELGVRDPLPAAFDAWFARCVVRDPARRFHDATEALGALRPVLAAPAGSSSLAATAPMATVPIGEVSETMVLPGSVPTGRATRSWVGPLAGAAILALGLGAIALWAARGPAERDPPPATTATGPSPVASSEPPPESPPPTDEPVSDVGVEPGAVSEPSSPDESAGPPIVDPGASPREPAPIARTSGRVALRSGGGCTYYRTGSSDAAACCRGEVPHGTPFAWRFDPSADYSTSETFLSELRMCRERAEARQCIICPRRADTLCCP
ncbi:MAG: protein kinase [Sandaracinaceae bacterium]|nr:protein kinase [Sandaracinaceae bacterium]